METVELTIDGKKVTAPKGSTILEAARKNGIDIPALCYHEGISPYGACRLCMVEINEGGRDRLVASCIYEAKDGIEVRTSTERVNRVRRMAMELLLARCPRSEVIRQMAAKVGVERTRFPERPPEEDDNCILCGLCVWACREVVGVSAIGFAYRGSKREVATPFHESPELCIGCGTCAYVCPTDCITFEDKGNVRIIWGREFEMQKCKVCGRYFAPIAQLEYIRKKAGLPEGFFDVCPDCRP